MNSAAAPTGALLAFDFGLRHIGVAVGQALTGTATPLDTVAARDGQPDWPHVERLLGEWRPDALVVGLPLNMDDSESELCRRARAFARRLHGRFGLRVLLVDERLSSREVWQQREAAAAAGRRNRRRGRAAASDHALAAVFILQTHLAAPGAAEEIGAKGS